MATVRVEGVEFKHGDARELARRARRYSTGGSLGGLTPGESLAVQLEQAVDEGGGSVTLADEEKVAAAAVVDEWRQSRDAPAAAADLRRVLASD
jgi:hypothetical protein